MQRRGLCLQWSSLQNTALNFLFIWNARGQIKCAFDRKCHFVIRRSSGWVFWREVHCWPEPTLPTLSLFLSFLIWLNSWIYFFQMFCLLNFLSPLQYSSIHRLETNRLRNVAKFFSFLLHSDALDWGVLEYIKLTELDTTSSSRIFLKILFQVCKCELVSRM